MIDLNSISNSISVFFFVSTVCVTNYNGKYHLKHWKFDQILILFFSLFLQRHYIFTLFFFLYSNQISVDIPTDSFSKWKIKWEKYYYYYWLLSIDNDDILEIKYYGKKKFEEKGAFIQTEVYKQRFSFSIRLHSFIAPNTQFNSLLLLYFSCSTFSYGWRNGRCWYKMNKMKRAKKGHRMEQKNTIVVNFAFSLQSNKLLFICYIDNASCASFIDMPIIIDWQKRKGFFFY